MMMQHIQVIQYYLIENHFYREGERIVTSLLLKSEKIAYSYDCLLLFQSLFLLISTGAPYVSFSKLVVLVWKLQFIKKNKV